MIANTASTSASQTQCANKEKSKKAGADDSDINLEDLLNDISKDVFRIYKTTLNPHADIHARNPLDLLTEIESAMEHAMLEIQHIEKEDLDVVNKEEKLCKGEYKKKQREDNVRIEQEQNDAKQADMKARMDRVVQKVGKAMMPRSTKKKIKKEVVVVKVDEDRLDFMRYLGDDMVELVDEIKQANGGTLHATTKSNPHSILH